MALSAKKIKGQIQSVENVKKITRAMELVSVSKMKKAVTKALATRSYALRAHEILVNLSKERALKHPLLRYGKDTKNLLVIVSSNKGLCGSYNVNVSKAVRQFMAKVTNKHEAEFEAVTVGKYSEQIARKLGLPIVGSFIELDETISPHDVTGIMSLIRNESLTGEYYNVVVVYTHYISALRNETVARQLLPVRQEIIENMIHEIDLIENPDNVHVVSRKEDMSLYHLEPNEEELLDATLTRLSEVQMYQALLESFASEHSARMFAMKNATENAERLVDDLKLSFNRARQAAITREISEIASGAEALSGSA